MRKTTATPGGLWFQVDSYQFTSVSEMIATGDKRFDDMLYDDKPNWDAAKKLYARGWPEGLKQMQKIVGKIGIKDDGYRTEGSSRRIRPDQGRVHIGRYTAGNGSCLVKRQRAMNKPVARLQFSQNCGANFYSEDDDYLARGACVYAVCMALEQQGYGVDLLVTNCNQYGCITVPVLLPGQRINPARLAAWTAHQDALNGTWAVRNSFPGCRYGNPTYVKETDGRVLIKTQAVSSARALVEYILKDLSEQLGTDLTIALK